MVTVLIFGASGMVGGAVLSACLASDFVDEVRVVSRRPVDVQASKLKGFLHEDFLDYSGAEAIFRDVGLCLFCLGTSVTQTSGEAEYRRITYEFPMAAAHALRIASTKAAFHYVSGQGAGLHSRMMWSRVKAEAERDLIAGFDAVCYRPGAIGGKPSGQTAFFIRALAPLLGVLTPFRGLYVKGQDVGRAMLQADREGLSSRILENAAIRDLADRAVKPASL